MTRGIKLSTDEILHKFKQTHGNKYSYDNMCFIGTRHKIEIICLLHGSFYQQPHDHYHGRGCPKCVGDTMDHILEKANTAHNFKYDYTITEYDKKNLINIKCPIHGIFNSNKNNHLAGHGCMKCGNKRTPTSLNMRIHQANIIHNNRYQYNESKTKSHDKANIICELHGLFTQQWANHLSGQGCPSCKITGRYSENYFEIYPSLKDIPASLYLLELKDNDVVFYKIGISKQLSTRIRQIPYDTKIILNIPIQLYDAFTLEQEFLKSYGYRNRYNPINKFGGDKECFIVSENQLSSIVSKLSKIPKSL